MNPIEQNYEELAALLEREYRAHEQLLVAAQGVNDAIKNRDIQTLQEKSSSLDNQVSAIEQIERQRSDCCGVLSGALGIERASIKLAALVEKAPQRFRDTLSTLHRSLKEMLCRISAINVSNQVLLEEGLELVRGRLSLIANPVDRFAQYRQGGRIRSTPAPFHPFINQTV